jgi:hypothetical protein
LGNILEYEDDNSFIGAEPEDDYTTYGLEDCEEEILEPEITQLMATRMYIK